MSEAIPAAAQSTLSSLGSQPGARSVPLRKRLLKGGTVVGLGEVLTLAMRFIRSVIAARLLSREDFGIAATFTLMVTLLEMISELSADKLLVQCKPGEAKRLQEVAQSVAVIRGLGMAAVLFLLAGPIASFFEIPQATGAFRCLALAPLFGCVRHQDTIRLQRELRFGPAVLVQTTAGLASTVAVLPLALWLRNYWALLWVQVIETGVAVVMSHLASQHRYRLRWDREQVRRLARFGWPLLLNGLLMYGIFQGDRLIIGRAYTMSDLGVYSIAATLAMMPVMLCTKVASSLVLPTLAGAQSEEERFERLYRVYQQVLAAVSGMLAAGLIVGGPWIVILLYGRKYEAAGSVIGWLGLMHALRLMRTGPTVAALARGDSRNSLIANLFRVLGLPLAIGVAAVGGELKWIAVAGVGGEVLALVASSGNVWKRHGLRPQIVLWPGLGFLAAVLVAGAAYWVLRSGGAVTTLAAAIGLSVLVGVMAVGVSGDLREMAWPRVARILPIRRGLSARGL